MYWPPDIQFVVLHPFRAKPFLEGFLLIGKVQQVPPPLPGSPGSAPPDSPQLPFDFHKPKVLEPNMLKPKLQQQLLKANPLQRNWLNHEFRQTICGETKVAKTLCVTTVVVSTKQSKQLLTAQQLQNLNM